MSNTMFKFLLFCIIASPFILYIIYSTLKERKIDKKDKEVFLSKNDYFIKKGNYIHNIAKSFNYKNVERVDPIWDVVNSRSCVMKTFSKDIQVVIDRYMKIDFSADINIMYCNNPDLYIKIIVFGVYSYRKDNPIDIEIKNKKEFDLINPIMVEFVKELNKQKELAKKDKDKKNTWMKDIKIVGKH